jgi:hypothetical protein
MNRLNLFAVGSVLVALLAVPGSLLGQGGTTIAAKECAGGDRVLTERCPADAYLSEVLRAEGVARAMAELEALVGANEDVRRDAHSFAHAIGIEAYSGVEDVGGVFSRCTPAHQSGCYHGVIQSYFSHQIAERGGALDAVLVNDLCRAHREAGSARWLLFQCAHGMGHGLVMVADGHLPGSLEGCDLVQDGWEREACYGGVFMENIVRATVPHHTVGRPDSPAHEHAAAPTAAGDHAAGHHDHAAVAAPAAQREPFEPLRANEPLYPCSALPDRYGQACYQMQTSAILHFNGYDIPAASRVCATAPDTYRSTCFQSLGRDISAHTAQTHRRAIDLCGRAPSEYEPWCHLGYAKNLIDLTADPEDGFAYCRVLPQGESKRFCYVAVGEQVWVLHDSVDRREDLCAAAESPYVEECRRGAGLSVAAAPPPPLPDGR